MCHKHFRELDRVPRCCFELSGWLQSTAKKGAECFRWVSGQSLPKLLLRRSILCPARQRPLMMAPGQV